MMCKTFKVTVVPPAPFSQTTVKRVSHHLALQHFAVSSLTAPMRAERLRTATFVMAENVNPAVGKVASIVTQELRPVL